MASNAIAGVGTKFLRWSGSAWQSIAEINSITGPSMSRDTIDVTSLDSTGGYREFITGFRNAGTVVLAMNFTRVTYEQMLEDFEEEDAQTYQIILPDSENTSLSFEGTVSELPLTIPADDKVTADVTIQVTGKVYIDSGTQSASTP